MPKAFLLRRDSDAEEVTLEVSAETELREEEAYRVPAKQDVVLDIRSVSMANTDHMYAFKMEQWQDRWRSPEQPQVKPERPNKLEALLQAAQLLMFNEENRKTRIASSLSSADESEETSSSFSGSDGASDLPSPTESEKSTDSLDGPTDSAFKPKHQCKQCGKIFKTKYTLTIHERMPDHTKTRPFVCGICGKGFRLSSTLCRHKIIHTAEKPHQCTFCEKAFNRSSTLKTHMKTHSQDKEFVCHICDKGFHQKGNLRNHMLIHTGEKPHLCETCGKAFSKISNLKFHMQSHVPKLL